MKQGTQSEQEIGGCFRQRVRRVLSKDVTFEPRPEESEIINLRPSRRRGFQMDGTMNSKSCSSYKQEILVEGQEGSSG